MKVFETNMKTSQLTGAALDWAVAKCEGHNASVKSADEQYADFIDGTSPEEIAKHAQFYSDFRAQLRPVLCRIEDSGFKSEFAAKKWKYSTDWAQGGPIIEREEISIEFGRAEFKTNWIAYKLGLPHEDNPEGGTTPLIAAMRCYVASKLGDDVDVPEELI